jgi:polyisoprenoid-binding protein YceI
LKVKGRFERYEGTLDLSGDPAVELTIDADSVQTKQNARDKHLPSPDFFNTESHPHVRFKSHTSHLAGGRLHVEGTWRRRDTSSPWSSRPSYNPSGMSLRSWPRRRLTSAISA